ncbi:MAG: RNA pyrophosphohydrolase [Telmatospirillum sp.]|nr:RNA pyrophosphohydrolase [Telmatospirillum sp.]
MAFSTRFSQTLTPEDNAMFGPMGYRSGIGIVLINDRRQVFAGHRRDGREPPWQMPQGGIDPGERLEQAVVRELMEELGTDRAVLVDAHPAWLSYDYPAPTATRRAKQYRGQRHKWFLLQFTGSDGDIAIDTDHAEFSAWRWMSPGELVTRVVGFKRDVYAAVLAHFFPHAGMPETAHADPSIESGQFPLQRGPSGTGIRNQAT